MRSIHYNFNEAKNKFFKLIQINREQLLNSIYNLIYTIIIYNSENNIELVIPHLYEMLYNANQDLFNNDYYNIFFTDPLEEEDYDEVNLLEDNLMKAKKAN